MTYIRTSARRGSLTKQPSFSVAIIGIGCRFPGAGSGPKAFWEFLLGSGCGIREIPPDRWNIDAYSSDDRHTIGKGYARHGGFLDDVRGFDSDFFDISPREAQAMDPQQRLLLEVGYEAVQDAGITLASLRRHRCGVFIGISTTDYGNILNLRRSFDEIWAGTGSAFSIAANRLSHRFNFTGPSLAVDTACSSSLAALDLAVNSLAKGACDAALVGGVNAMIYPAAFVAFSRANMLSPTGEIYSFDKRANGFVRGEGAGMILLKPLARAIADDDHIYAVIRGTSVNQDGRTSTLTAPSLPSQIAMLETLCERAAVDPGAIDYVEAHGTGTPVGDPIEARAVGRAIGRSHHSGPVLIGSVKPNVGHLEAAAGICGLIKATLAVHYGTVPPNRNFQEASPHIPFDVLNLKVPVSPTPLGNGAGSRFAAVNSFGFGGTNASALLESHSEPAHTVVPAVVARRTRPTPKTVQLFPVSAANEAALRTFAERIATDVRPGGNLEHRSLLELAGALATRRDHLAERAVVIASTRDELLEGLDLLASGGSWESEDRYAVPRLVRGRARAQRKLAFTFAGQGGQWWGMARRLLAEDLLYRRTVEDLDEVFRAISGWSLVDAMLADESQSKVDDDSAVTGPVIFANQIGLLALWRSRGIIPDLVIGHSFGEVAAAYAADCISLEAAANLIHKRGLIRSRIDAKGAMAAVALPADQLALFLPGDESVVIAAYNGPAMHTLSGEIEAMREVLARISAADPGVFVRLLKMDFGWHGPQLDPGREWFFDSLGTVDWKAGSIPVISTVTGQLETCFDAAYWWRNLRDPVSYYDAIKFALDLGVDGFLELGPHRTLAPVTASIADSCGAKPVIVSSLHREQDDDRSLAHASAVLHVSGIEPRPDAVSSLRPPQDLKLPDYPWTKRPLWIDSEEARHALFVSDDHALLGKRNLAPRPSWTGEINLNAFGWLKDHAVQGDCVFPGAGYVELMVAAAWAHFGHGPVELHAVHFLEALSVAPDDAVMLRTELDPERGTVEIYSLRRGGDSEWRRRATAYVRRYDFTLTSAASSTALPSREPDIGRDEFYELADRQGLNYGPAFRCVESAWVDDLGMVARIVPEPDVARRLDRQPVHMALLDCCLQSPIVYMAWQTGAWLPGEPLPPRETTRDRMRLKLPVGIERIRVAGPFTGPLLVRFDSMRKASGEFEGGRYEVLDEDGVPVVSIEGLELKELGARGRSPEAEIDAAAYVEGFYPIEAIPATAATGRWLVLSGNGSTGAQIHAFLAASGAEVEHIQRDKLDDSQLADVVARAIGDPLGLNGIVFTASMHQTLRDDSTSDELVTAVEADVLALIAAGQALDRCRTATQLPALWLVTCGARTLPEDAPLAVAGLAQAPLVGLMRTIANECREFKVRQLDLDTAALAAQAWTSILAADGEETEIIVRGERILVPRIERRHDLPARRIPIDLGTTDDNFAVTMSQPGVLENIRLRQAPSVVARPHEVVVTVGAVGLNFRDLMAAGGFLPDETDDEQAWWRHLGLEFAGTVAAIGPDVHDLAIGDRVMGFGRGLLRRFAAIPARGVVSIPDSLSFEEATTIPTGFMTSVYALEWVARLQPGERVLIHLATGGVGQAAIQVAQAIGAEIFATAGSDRKRAHLREQGIQHVMNSRSLDFADEIRQATDGRGVDVVLNSLAGAAIDKGLECLAPFGRFVEIGKRDLYADKPMGLKVLHRNNSFSVIDLSTLGVERPDILRTLMATVAERLASGLYRPLPCKTFSVSDTANAFGTMWKAEHIGKIVVTMDEPVVSVEQDLAAPARLDAAGSYLVTGGLGGVGLTVADWLSNHGAGRLILGSRRGKPDDTAAATIAAIHARGTEVECVPLDVTDEACVAALVARLAGGDKPLRGVVHSAAVIDDGFLSQLDAERIRRVVRPKVAGAWNLQRALKRTGSRLDFFVSFSSLAQLLGSAGQANYTAANAFLDAFAAYRQGQHEPGLAIDWGALGESGFVARSASMTSYLESLGLKMMSDAVALDGFGRFIRSELSSVGFASVDWSGMARGMGQTPRLSSVLSRVVGNNPRIRAALIAAPRGEWENMLADTIRREVAKVLKVDPEQIALERALTELGLDSLSSFELKNRIEAILDLNIPVAKFLQSPSIAALAEMVAAAFEQELAAAARAAAAESLKEGPTEGAATEARRLVAQAAGVRFGGLALTSQAARDAFVHRYTLQLDPSIEPHRMVEALQVLAAAEPAITLSAERDEAGTVEVACRDIPQLEDTAEIGFVEPLAGPLWRFGLAFADDGTPRLSIAAHAAGGDQKSVSLVAQRLHQLLAGKEIPDNSASFARFMDSHCLALDGVEGQREVAFWSELLVAAPGPVMFKRRRRALAPAGCGRNRGAAAVVRRQTTLPVQDSMSDVAVEAVAVLAFARALAELDRRRSVVMELGQPLGINPGRVDAVTPMLGPWPMILDCLHGTPATMLAGAIRQIATVRAHGPLNSLAIEELLSETLRRQDVIVGQFGFAFLNADGLGQLQSGPMDIAEVLSASALLNDLRLTAVRRGSKLVCTFAYDADVLTADELKPLMTHFVKEVRKLGRDLNVVQLADAMPADGRSEAPVGVATAKLALAARPQATKGAASGALAHGAPTLHAGGTKAEIIPATMQQQRVLELFDRPETPAGLKPYWTLHRALLIKPSIDIQRMNRAVAAVIERHENLRMRFVRTGTGGWGAVVEPRAGEGLIIQSARPRDRSEMEQLVTEQCMQPIDPTKDPLVRVSLWRCEEGDVLLVQGHHLVLDGWSMGVLLNDVIKGYLGVPLGPPPQMTQAVFCREIQRIGDVDTLREREAYFRELLLPAVPMPRLGRVAKGRKPNVELFDVHEKSKIDVNYSVSGRQLIAATARGPGRHGDQRHAVGLCRDARCPRGRRQHPAQRPIREPLRQAPSRLRRVGHYQTAGSLRCAQAQLAV
jgi:acyl transferase domain-containing protein/acyl carrier protein